MFGTNRTVHWSLLVLTTIACGGIYFWIVPGSIAVGDTATAVYYVLIGWIPFTLIFYLLGRLTTDPEGLPSMRPATSGAVIVVLSLLISIGLDSWGLSPSAAPEAHLLQGAGVFLGLALLGWGIGKRSEAIANLYESETI